MLANHGFTANDGPNPLRGIKIDETSTSLLSALILRIRKHCRQQQDYERLLMQPDYLLDDIGLTRSQIEAATRRRLF